MSEVLDRNAHLPPSAKQVKFLDGLAAKLGYPSGKSYARELFGVNQYGASRWDRETLSIAIDNAMARVKKQRRIRGREQRSLERPGATQGNPGTEGG